MLKKLYNFILDLIFPIECLGCHKEETYFCDDCLKKIIIYDFPPIFEHPIKFMDGVFYATDYKQPLMQKIIRNFKFNYIKELAMPAAKILAKFWTDYNTVLARRGAPQRQIIECPIIIPVPLNKKRLLERGFNQAELIAKIFAAHFNYPLLTDEIIRFKNTPHQVGLNKKERLINVRKAFTIIYDDLIKNQTIILIDDVVTTGSTLEEVAKSLKLAGAKKVWGLTVAKD